MFKDLSRGSYLGTPRIDQWRKKVALPSANYEWMPQHPTKCKFSTLDPVQRFLPPDDIPVWTRAKIALGKSVFDCLQ